jgi:hypothetical protein
MNLLLLCSPNSPAAARGYPFLYSPANVLLAKACGQPGEKQKKEHPVCNTSPTSKHEWLYYGTHRNLLALQYPWRLHLSHAASRTDFDCVLDAQRQNATATFFFGSSVEIDVYPSARVVRSEHLLEFLSGHLNLARIQQWLRPEEFFSP